MSETDSLADLMKASEDAFKNTEARQPFITPPIGTYPTALVAWIAKPFESRKKHSKDVTHVRFTMKLRLHCEHLPEFHGRDMAVSYTTEPSFKDEKTGELTFIDLAKLKGIYNMLTDGGEAESLEAMSSFFAQAAEAQAGLLANVSERSYEAKDKSGQMTTRTASNINIDALCELPESAPEAPEST